MPALTQRPFTVLSFRLILQALGYSKALYLGSRQPAAVPLILSASEQAKLETEAIDRDK